MLRSLKISFIKIYHVTGMVKSSLTWFFVPLLKSCSEAAMEKLLLVIGAVLVLAVGRTGECV